MIKQWIYISFILFNLSILGGNGYAQEEFYPTTPKTNNGKKWRVGYIEGMLYVDYPSTLTAIINGLAKLGWLDKKMQVPRLEELGSTFNETDKLWTWLATNIKSDYIEFVADAYWTANNSQERETNKQAILKRVIEQKDLDLMLCMGTKGGKDIRTLTEEGYTLPTFIASVSNAINSEIIKSAEDSGFDHLFARVDPGRYERQLGFFHDIFNFKRLGIAYKNTQEGKETAAIVSAEIVARERNIKLERCHITSQQAKPEHLDELIKCHEKLAPRIDAMYITLNSNLNNKQNIPAIIKPLHELKRLTFAQPMTGGYAEYGVFVSMASPRFSYVGDFLAKKIAKVFNGAQPRQLKQILETPLTIAINLETAKALEIEIPTDIIAIADEIYGYSP